MLVKDEQSKNAKSPIEVTPSGIVYDVNPAGANDLSSPSTIKHRLSADAYVPLNVVNEEHCINGLPTIEVTLSGIVMLVKELHPEKACSPIEVTLSGIVMLVKDEQFQNAYSPIEVTPSGRAMLVKDEQ